MNKREFLSTIEKYNPNYDMDIISRAYDVAEEMHRNQLRKSGEEYLIHPLAVAVILAELGMDSETIAAGLLHDVIEDTSYTVEEISEYCAFCSSANFIRAFRPSTGVTPRKYRKLISGITSAAP